MAGEKRKKKKITHEPVRGHTTAMNKPIHPPTTLFYSNTAVRSTAVTVRITVDHSNQDPRSAQKPIYYAILANQIWS